MTQEMVSPGRTAAPVAQGIQMKKRNPVGVWLGLPLVTLGIYHLVWYYRIHAEMVQFDRRRKFQVAGPTLVLLFLSWTVVAPMLSYYNTGKRIAEAQRVAGLPITCNPTVGLLLSAASVGAFYYQRELNKVTDSYGDMQEGSQIPLFA